MEQKPLIQSVPFGRMLLVAFGLLMFVFAQAQPRSSEAQERLAKLVLDAVNQVRDSMGVKPIMSDPILNEAAAVQAQWCKQHDSLSHYQFNNKRLYEPINRVLVLGGQHDGVAENLLYRHPEFGQDPEELAILMAWQWVHSPGHFKNMITATHGLSGLGFAYDARSGRLYACQVFATADWDMPLAYKIPKRTYRIKPRDPQECVSLDNFAGRDKEFAYGFSYVADSIPRVLFQHQQARLVKQMIGQRRDAIASDIIFRSQFPCGGPNTLHGSPYFDGYMQRPRTWKWLSKHAVLDTNNPQLLRVFTTKIPALPADSIQINTVFFKNKHFCRFTMPVSQESGGIAPRGFELPPDTLPLMKSETYTRRNIAFKVPFAKGIATPDPADLKPILDSLRHSGGEVLHLRIRGYASIEGPIANNQDLYTNRAENIRKVLQARQKQVIPMESSAAENWAEFRRDIKGSPFKWMKAMSDDQVRDTLVSHATLKSDLEYILAPHRYAQVEIDVRFAHEPMVFTNTMLADSMLSALEKKHYLMAHQLQSEMLRRFLADSLAPELILGMSIPLKAGSLPLLHNQVWVGERLGQQMPMSNNPELLKIAGTKPWFHIRRLLIRSQWMAHGFFDKKESPAKVFQAIQDLRSTATPDGLIDTLEFNYYIAMARWNGRNGRIDGAILDSIKNRYAGTTIEAREAVTLGRFFNQLRASATTVRMLKPIMKANATHEDLVFLFAWTASAHLDLVSEDEWLSWMEVANALNPSRWHDQVARDWQLLRWERIKDKFCDCSSASAFFQEGGLQN